VLEEIGASEVPQLMVLNKLDLTGLPPAVERNEYDRIVRVRVSANVVMDCRSCALHWLKIALEKLRTRDRMSGADQRFADHSSWIRIHSYDFLYWSTYVAQ
jgi:50S ribosomal subunit-associated GTPase HflX